MSTKPGQLQPDGDEHPVDLAVNRIPVIARLRRKLLRMSLEIRKQVGDRQAFIAYEDLRLEHAVRRQEAFFDLGFEQGRVEGMADSLNAGIAIDSGARAFAKQVQVSMMTANMPPDRVIAVLLEMARSLVLGKGIPARWRRRTQRR